jgi:biopolymer transport protein ExbB/TolQ
METTFDIGNILRAVASAMHYPVIVLLIFFLLAAVALLGWLLAEYLTERRHMRASLPALLEELQHTNDLNGTIAQSGLLQRQKDALTELVAHPDFSPELREALAVRLLDAEQERYDRIVRSSELVARLAPMFGLLGTLIPLGPGIIALGQGDTFTLSASMLTAFDTTVAGLLAAAVATVVSSVRKSWYKEYISTLEVLSQCVLDRKKEAAA